MEGVTLGMNYGLRRLAELGVKPRANPRHWRRGQIQILAADHGGCFRGRSGDVQESEGAAYGAALQALWCWRLQRGERVSISQITDEFVQLNRAETAAHRRQFQDLPRIAGDSGRDLAGLARRFFSKHRHFLRPR